MEFTIVAIIALSILMAMVSVAAWMRTLTSPPLLVLIPAVTCAVAVLSLLVRAESPLLPALAILMAAAAVVLIGFSIGWAVITILDQRNRDSVKTSRPDGVETE